MSAPAVHLQAQNDVLTRAQGVLPLYVHEAVLHLSERCHTSPVIPTALDAASIADLDTVLTLCTTGCDPKPLTSTLSVPYLSALVDGLYLVLSTADVLEHLREHTAEGAGAEPTIELLEDLESLRTLSHDLTITADLYELGIADAVQRMLDHAHTHRLRPDLPNTHLLFDNGDPYRPGRTAQMQHALAHAIDGDISAMGLRARLTNAEVAALFPADCGVTALELPTVLTPEQLEILSRSLCSTISVPDQLASIYAATR